MDKMVIKIWEMTINKAKDNNVPLKDIENMTWEEADWYIDNKIAEYRRYNSVDARIKRAYNRNKKYYDTIEPTYSMDSIMDAYNESKQSCYY